MGHKQVKVKVQVQEGGRGGAEVHLSLLFLPHLAHGEPLGSPVSEPRPVPSSEEKAGWETWQGALWVLGIILYRHRVGLGASPGEIL